MAAAFPSTSRKVSVESYHIKEPKMDIPPHRKTVLPIKGPVIHDASEFMAVHLELNYVNVSYPFQYFTGAHVTGAPGTLLWVHSLYGNSCREECL